MVSSREHVPSLSFDINPVMATFSAAKSAEILGHQRDIWSYIESVGDLCTSHNVPESDPLSELLHPESASLVRSYIDGIPFPASVEDGSVHDSEILAATMRDSSLFINPEYAFCKAAIFVTLRTLSDPKKHANPTWISTTDSRVYFSKEELAETLKTTSLKMLEDLKGYFNTRSFAAPSLTVATDSRRMPLRDNSIDRIITSPPYLTRIDYAVSTTPELSLFGNFDLLTHVRHNTMGAPVITKEPKVQKTIWGKQCNDFLNAVANHQTKAAKSYYWKNIVQYFIDMERSFDEIIRVMKPGARGLIVVQSSYFKEVEAKLGEMYVEMAENKGLRASIAFREEVKGHLAHVNTKSSAYMANKVYYEDFVYIEKVAP